MKHGLLMQGGSTVDNVPGVASSYNCGVNSGLGVHEGMVVSDLLALDPAKSFFFEDIINGFRLEYTRSLRYTNEDNHNPQVATDKSQHGII